MEGSSGPEEQILWPASVLAGVVMCAVVYEITQKVKSIFTLGFYSILTVPPSLAVMNVFWFWKISKGMVKALSKTRKHTENGKTD